MTSFVKLMISRIAQFYTDEREYRIRGNKSNAIQKLIYEGIKELVALDPKMQLQGMISLIETIKNMNPETADKYGKFKNEELMREWDREDGKKERYIPDFDVKVKIMDERPTSRQYYEQIAMQLYGRALGPKAFWSTIMDGKFPSIDEILQELQQMQQAQTQPQQQTQPTTAPKG
jgi:hypothetical protein